MRHVRAHHLKVSFALSFTKEKGGCEDDAQLRYLYVHAA